MATVSSITRAAGPSATEMTFGAKMASPEARAAAAETRAFTRQILHEDILAARAAGAPPAAIADLPEIRRTEEYVLAVLRENGVKLPLWLRADRLGFGKHGGRDVPPLFGACAAREGSEAA